MLAVYLGEVKIGDIAHVDSAGARPWWIENTDNWRGLWWVRCPGHTTIKTCGYASEEEAKNFFKMSLPVVARESLRYI